MPPELQNHSPVDRTAGIQVIARAVAVLRALKGEAGGLSLAQIAEQVDLPRSTVQRIVRALQTERMVIASGSGAGIQLGPELHALAENARYNTVDLLRPVLLDIARETGETVDLSVLRGNSLIFIDQLPGSHRLRTVSQVGEAFPLTTTANGKACLALMPDSEVTRLARSEWARQRRDGDLPALFDEIGAARRLGYAQDLDQHTVGISAVGIGFRNWKGDLFAVSVPTPSTRFAQTGATLANALLQALPAIRLLLGG